MKKLLKVKLAKEFWDVFSTLKKLKMLEKMDELNITSK